MAGAEQREQPDVRHAVDPQDVNLKIAEEQIARWCSAEQRHLTGKAQGRILLLQLSQQPRTAAVLTTWYKVNLLIHGNLQIQLIDECR